MDSAERRQQMSRHRDNTTKERHATLRLLEFVKAQVGDMPVAERMAFTKGLVPFLIPEIDELERRATRKLDTLKALYAGG
jgi:hypothetical protein